MVLSDCVCPGHELRLECTVVGVGLTVWRGSAFSDCSGSRLVLRHSQFENGTYETCITMAESLDVASTQPLTVMVSNTFHN